MRYVSVAISVFVLFSALLFFSYIRAHDGFIEDRDPEALDMVAVEGTEISNIRHLGSHFNKYQGEIEANLANEQEKVNYILHEIGRRDGLAQFFHPGEYTGDDPSGYKWYLPFYKKHDHLVGIEVYNRRDVHPNDRALWDQLLTSLMPDRPVWAFGNDDNHVSDADYDFLVSWNTFLMEDLSKAEVKEAYKNGQFLAHNRTGKHAPSPPDIKQIRVQEENSKIKIKAHRYDEIKWISDGEAVGTEKEFNIYELDSSNYVRAKAIKYENGEEGRTLTQPFGIDDQQVILNPYQDIKWEKATPHKANFHAHTAYSDGIKLPHERIDEYYKNGYTILSLTDHATYDPNVFLTYPWDEVSQYDFIELSIENSVHYFIYGYLPDSLSSIAARPVAKLGNGLSYTGLALLNYSLISLCVYLLMRKLKSVIKESGMYWDVIRICLIFLTIYVMKESMIKAPFIHLFAAQHILLKLLALCIGTILGSFQKAGADYSLLVNRKMKRLN